MSLLLSATAAAYALLSASLALLAALAWARSRSARQALLFGGFALTALGGIVTSLLLFQSSDATPPLLTILGFSGAGLAFIYAAAVKR